MINKLNFKTSFMLLLGLFTSLTAIAKDITDQVRISADMQQAELKRNVVVFKNNVEISHGDKTIKADILEVHRRVDLGEGKQLLIAKGNPATFSGTLKSGSPVTAQAKEIHYDVATSILLFNGNASINQSGQVMKASTISYDHGQELITAKKEKNTDQRVHTILTPSNKEKLGGE